MDGKNTSLRVSILPIGTPSSKLTGFSVDDHPRGYPNLAAFMISSDNFLMCRGFAFLHSRVLLHRQDELAEMEKTLLAMDEEDIEFGEELALQSRRRDDLRPEQPSRKSLIDKIDTKLKDYGRELHAARHLDASIRRTI